MGGITTGRLLALMRYVADRAKSTITGIKSIANNIVVAPTTEPDNRNSVLNIVMPDTTKGTVPDHNSIGTIYFTDSSGEIEEWQGVLGAVDCINSPNGSNLIWINAFKNEAGATDKARLTVGYDTNGIKFASAPATSPLRNSASDIVTRGYLAHYEPRLRFNATPAYSATFAEAVAANPYSFPADIFSGNDVKALLLTLDAPAQSAGVAVRATVQYGESSVVAQVSSRIISTDRTYSYFYAGHKNGWAEGYWQYTTGIQSSINGLDTSRVPVFCGDNPITGFQLRVYTQDAIPAGTTMSLYVAKEV